MKVTKEEMKSSRLSLTLNFRRAKSSLNLTSQDPCEGLIPLNSWLFLSFQMLQAATTNTSMNMGLVQAAVAVWISCNLLRFGGHTVPSEDQQAPLKGQ